MNTQAPRRTSFTKCFPRSFFPLRPLALVHSWLVPSLVYFGLRHRGRSRRFRRPQEKKHKTTTGDTLIPSFPDHRLELFAFAHISFAKVKSSSAAVRKISLRESVLAWSPFEVHKRMEWHEAGWPNNDLKHHFVKHFRAELVCEVGLISLTIIRFAWLSSTYKSPAIDKQVSVVSRFKAYKMSLDNLEDFSHLKHIYIYKFRSLKTIGKWV